MSSRIGGNAAAVWPQRCFNQLFFRSFIMFTLILVAINVATLVVGAKCPCENNEPDTGPFYCCC